MLIKRNAESHHVHMLGEGAEEYNSKIESLCLLYCYSNVNPLALLLRYCNPTYSIVTILLRYRYCTHIVPWDGVADVEHASFRKCRREREAQKTLDKRNDCCRKIENAEQTREEKEDNRTAK